VKSYLQNAAWIVGMFAGLVAAVNGVDLYFKNHPEIKIFVNGLFGKRKKDQGDDTAE
jgi:hypothetical protein